MRFLAEYGPWWELFIVLSCASTAVIAAARLAEHWLTSPAKQRMVWQIAMATILLLLAVELSGAGRAVTPWLRPRTTTDRNASPATGLIARTSAPKSTASSVAALSTLRLDASSADSQASSPTPEPLAATAADVSSIAVKGSSADLAGDAAEGQRLAASPHDHDLRMLAPPSSALGATIIEDWATASPPPLRTLSTVGAQGPRPTSEPAAWPLLIWLSGTVAIGLQALASHIAVAACHARTRSLADTPLLQRVGHWAARLNMPGTVRLVETHRLKSPAAFGFLRPTIALPLGFTDDFSKEEQDAILVHELAHLAAGDQIWSLMANLLVALMWWQPAVWLLRKRLRFACELAADEVTLIVPRGPEHLASGLITMGRQLLNQPQPGWLPATGDGYRSNLGRRVARLLQLESQRRPALAGASRTWMKSTLVLLMVVSMVFGSAWLRPEAALAEGGTAMTKFRLSWSRTLAAAAVAAVLGPLSGDLPADEPLKAETPQVAPAETQLAMLQEGDREREERRAAEAERKEREEREMREQRREGERRPEGEARERAEEELRVMRREREELKNVVQNLQRELEELKRNGQEEAARHTAEKLERVKREFAELEVRLKEAQGPPRRPDQPRPEMIPREEEKLPREELERRAHHIRVAAENLHAAGLHDQAEKLMREAERLVRESEPRPHQPEQPQMRREPEPRPDDPIHHLERQINEMRGQMEDMRRVLKELLERERR